MWREGPRFFTKLGKSAARRPICREFLEPPAALEPSGDVAQRVFYRPILVIRVG